MGMIFINFFWLRLGSWDGMQAAAALRLAGRYDFVQARNVAATRDT